MKDSKETAQVTTKKTGFTPVPIEMKPTLPVRQEHLQDSRWASGLRALATRGETGALRQACRSACQRADACGRLAAGEYALRLGEWALAVQLGRSLRLTTLAAKGWAVASVAAFAAGKPSLGMKAMKRCGENDRRYLASLWMHAEFAGHFDRQRSTMIAGRDPSVSLLNPLLARAASILDRHIESTPHYADRYYHRGMCLAGLGLNEEARESLERALEINPFYLKAREAAETLSPAQVVPVED